MMQQLRKMILKWTVYACLSALGLLTCFYIGFIGLLKFTELSLVSRSDLDDALDVVSSSPHEIELLDNGRFSLTRRIQMIREAKKSIDLEFFIYELDLSSRLISQELVKKSKEGVKVRILVDFSIAVFKLGPNYAHELSQNGIQVRYYNTSSLARFFSVQHRTHRKLLIVDNQSAMLGGRNIANDYFDLSEKYNFLDTDIVVSGQVVPRIAETFQHYWDSDLSQVPEKLAEVPEASNFLVEDEKIQGLLKDVTSTDLSTVNPPSMTFACPQVRFATDYPSSGVRHRKVFNALIEELSKAKKEVIGESPYFVLDTDGIAVLREPTKRGVKIKFLTNSLRSTDAYYTVGPLYWNLNKIAMNGLELFAYRGDSPIDYSFSQTSKHWGVHAKRGVIDDHTVVIGTYNIDPRSANLNSELILVCRGSKDLAKAVRQSIESRIKQSEIVLSNTHIDRNALVEGASETNYGKMLLTLPITTMFQFLL